MTRRAAALGLCVLLAAAPGSAQLARPDAAYWKGYLADTRDLLQAPFSWEPEQHGLGLAVVGLTVGVYSLDGKIQEEVQAARGRTGYNAAKRLEHLGDGVYLLPLLGAAYAYGHYADKTRARRVALYGLESFVISGLFVTAAKQLAGRHRPYTGDGREAWDGPTSSGSTRVHSFPSGHATSAFTVATVVAHEYEEVPWAPQAAYGLAALAGASRVVEDKHWASDVVFGGALGYFTAKAILGYHSGSGGKWSLLPAAGPGAAGITVVRRF